MTEFVFKAIRGRKIATATLEGGEFTVVLSDRSIDDEATVIIARNLEELGRVTHQFFIEDRGE